MKHTFRLLSVFALVSLLLAACYWNDDVKSYEVGIVSDGGRLGQNCLAPGVYSNAGFFTDLIEVQVGTVTFEVSDPSVATRDTQIVGVTVAVQARRKADCDSVRNFLTNWPALRADDVLIQTITATTNEAIKVGVRSMNLDQLLDDRNGLSTAIVNALTEDAAKYSVEIINVSIKDIDLDDAYEAKLKEKAAITVDIEIANRQQDKIKAEQEAARIQQEQRALTLAAQLKAEEAQTSVEVEIAQREGQKIKAANEVYQQNERAFELERLRVLKDIMAGNSQVYFVPQGSDITLFLNQTGTPVAPVAQP